MRCDAPEFTRLGVSSSTYGKCKTLTICGLPTRRCRMWADDLTGGEDWNGGSARLSSVDPPCLWCGENAWCKIETTIMTSHSEANWTSRNAIAAPVPLPDAPPRTGGGAPPRPIRHHNANPTWIRSSQIGRTVVRNHNQRRWRSHFRSGAC